MNVTALNQLVVMTIDRVILRIVSINKCQWVLFMAVIQQETFMNWLQDIDPSMMKWSGMGIFRITVNIKEHQIRIIIEDPDQLLDLDTVSSS